MTSVAQKRKHEQEQSETVQIDGVTVQRVKLFVNDSRLTMEQSLRALKRVTFAAASHILCVRGALDDKSFVPVVFGQVRTLLVKKGVSKVADKVLDLVAEFSNAISKRQLRRIILGFYDDSKKPENLYEWWDFNFEYNEETGTAGIVCKASQASSGPQGTPKQLSLPFSGSEVEENLRLLLLHIQGLTGLMGPLANPYQFGFMIEYMGSKGEADFQPKRFVDLTPNAPVPLAIRHAQRFQQKAKPEEYSMAIPIGAIKMPFSGVGVTAFTRKAFQLTGLDSSQSPVRASQFLVSPPSPEC